MNIVILISGSGSNLQAILDAVAMGKLASNPVLVVSNRKAAYGLVRARKTAVSTLYFPFKPYRDAGKSRTEYDADLASRITEYEPDLIVLAGWMHILSSAFLDKFPQQVINLHPALPGQFSGTHAIERAYLAFQNEEIAHSGCMVHYVIPEVDAGEVIVERIVPIKRDELLADFEERVHTVEHELIVEAIQMIDGYPEIAQL